jgi:hypothetical protein
MEVTGRRERKCKQLLDDLKETTGYWKLKEETPNRTRLRTHFGRGYGRVVRETTKRIIRILTSHLRLLPII